MNQNKIAQFIKEVRNKSNLSQEKFGEKYGVSYQAVSKWENAKNIPDIGVLREICKDYNKDINELLNDGHPLKHKHLIRNVLLVAILIIVIIILLMVLRKTDNGSFEFKTLKTTCDNFEISGSIAYDKERTSIYISNITYCGDDDTSLYKSIDCTFYENNGSIKKMIDNYQYNGSITLEDFLKEVKFNVDHYSKSCTMYKENALSLEIKATLLDSDETLLYTIPLRLEDNCK